MILHDVARISPIGADNLVDSTLGEASGSDHIGHMGGVHPVEPLRLNVCINRYRNVINDHAVDYNLYRYCHNDPINKTDPFGEEGWTDYPRIAAELNFNRRAIEIVRTIQREAGEAGKAVQDAANANAIAKGDGSVAPGGLANAVRHAVGAGQLVGAVGSQKAEKILAIHEDNAKDKRDTFIDKHNNRVGLAIGATVNSNQELAKAVAGAVKDGSLIIDNKDSRIPKALRDK